MLNDEVLAMRYNVWISGTMLDISKKQCINSVEIKETVEGADKAVIKISDPEFLFIEDNIFVEENPIKIMLGWSNTTYRITFEGYISTIDIDFQSNGVPVLTVTCMDNTHKMNREKKNNTYSNTTSADVVKSICANYGFTCVVDSSYQFTIQETITQSDQTDIDFIQKLAKDEVYPFTARLVDDTFYYVKKGALTTPKMTLTYLKYPHDIISFSPKINKETKKVAIEKSTIDTSSKEVETTKNDLPENTNVGGVSSGGSQNNSGYTYSENSSKGENWSYIS